MVQSRSINLDIKRIAGYREFCNKIWNTFKFGYSKFAEAKEYDEKSLQPRKLFFLNKWILAKLNQSIKGVINNYSKYQFGLATTAFFSFWKYELCDVYLEATKPIFNGTNADLKRETSHVLFQCIETGLRLLHPMMPFLTEELYQKLPTWKDKKESVSIHAYPTPLEVLYQDDDLNEHFAQIENEFETINKVFEL
jgi:valyl-tRNA synthetase